VDTILAHPVAPIHLATKLWQYFVSPSPSAHDLQPLVDAYKRTSGDIRSMVEAMFRSPSFYSAASYRGLVKSPTEFTVGLSRQFGLPFDPVVINAGEAMGQALFDPPNVAGWPGGADWMNTGAWMARMRTLLYQGARHQSSIAASLAAAGAKAPAEAVDHAAATMVDGRLTAAARQAVIDHATSQGSGLSSAVAADIVFLIGATPEYQLA
jgi:uncharacterized protein (DUF1800 family)